jgi:FtsH-binding integral membrane protein
MSYAMEYPIAARAREDARAAFIRRTYGHLAGAILAFVVLETLLFQIPGIDRAVMGALTDRVSWLIVLGAFIGVGWLAEMWANSQASPGLQYLGLGLYVVAEALIFLPILIIARSKTDPNIIPTAGIMTLAIFGGLTIATFLTGRDFSFLRTGLSVCSFLALGLIIASIIFGFSLGLVFCFAMVALISGYILYYTSNVLYHYRTDQHVAAALALFACVATLFWYILRIVMSSRD